MSNETATSAATVKSGLSKKKKVGYALGIFADSVYYNMFYTYYLVFLNEIVGVEAKYSSIVIFISILWDAVTDPMIGAYTDKPGVDKRKVMGKALFPLAIFYIVAWTSIGANFDSQFLKVLFYTIIAMFIWLFYTYYTIPYYAVVAELTNDYDERTQIRSWASTANAIAVALGNILPALVPSVAIILGEKYKSESYAVIAAILAILGTVGGFVCVKSLKGVYKPKPVIEGQQTSSSFGGIMKSFGKLLKMYPARTFLGFVFLFLMGSSMAQANITYSVIDCIKMDYTSGTAIYIVVLSIAMLIFIPIVEKVAKVKDRRFATILFLCITVAGLFAMKIIGLDAKVGNFPVMIIFLPFFYGIGIATFWTLFYSLAYDLVEIDEFKTGTRKESIITAFPQLIQKFGSACGILIAGQLLSAIGYDSSADTVGNESLFKIVSDPKIIAGMSNISTLIPGIIISLSIVCMILFPVTRERYEALKEALNKKNKGESYSTEGFKELLK